MVYFYGMHNKGGVMNVQKKKLLVMSSLLVTIVLLGIGTIAYFRRTVNGDITGQAGNLVLIVNEADAVLNETFSVILQRSETENFIMPDDRGTFDLNIDSTGSSDDVEVTIAVSRINLPENLRFYLDENYTKELTTKTFIIEKSDDMTMTVPIYWFWDGSINDEDDSNFINTTISANVSVSATIFTPFVETLISKAVLDTNVDFNYGSTKFIESEQCNEYGYQCYENGEYCDELEQQCYVENGRGLMMMDSTQNDKYPIVYYRGDVNNNNVIYAGQCWLIVRTTETGGVKLIYNGGVKEDNDGNLSCSNYSNVTVETIEEVGKYNENYLKAYINKETYAFNSNYNSPVYVGYMYNDTNKFYSSSTLDGAGYIAHLSDNTVDQETGRHAQNLKDSRIKKVIDRWFESNIKNKIKNRLAEDILEDTVWCADRSLTSTNFPIENYATNNVFAYSASTRLGMEEFLGAETIPSVTPSLVCNRDMDKFTVDSANGNGDLTYPIGMLTGDEILMAGSSVNSFGIITYLTIPTHQFWAVSPNHFYDGMSSAFMTISSTLEYSNVGNDDVGVRPSISLGLWAKLQGGDGSFKSPYNFDVPLDVEV